MEENLQAKQGDVLEYQNLTFQSSYLGVVVGRNEENNGYTVVRLNRDYKPFILLNGGVDFDTAFDCNIVKVYPEAKHPNAMKLW